MFIASGEPWRSFPPPRPVPIFSGPRPPNTAYCTACEKKKKYTCTNWLTMRGILKKDSKECVRSPMLPAFRIGDLN